jgi:hypothetical protein
MRRSKRISLLALVGVFLAGALLETEVASAQANGTATTTGAGTIIQGVAIHKDRDLEFGAMVASASSGTCVITAASTTTRSATGGVTLTDQGGLTPASAQFTVTGNPNFTYTITLPTSVTITNQTSGNGETMTITDMTKSNNGPQLNGQGTETWWAGGTLNVGADQVAGRYTGTFDVGVAYD